VIVIGIVLATTAVLLAYESKALLFGETASPETLQKVRHMISRTAGIAGTNEIVTMHPSPNEVLLNLSLHFSVMSPATDVQPTITRLETEIKEAIPDLKRVFIEGQSWPDHQNSLMDSSHP
jgi:divalent metal cation (Fe/Co/Zn/Cd) transporter